MGERSRNQLLDRLDHFADTLPQDAIKMSRCGVAEGFDDLQYGIKWAKEGKTPATPIVSISVDGVQFHRRSKEQQEWIEADGDLSLAQTRLRETVVDMQNFTKWEDLHSSNRDFLDSLLWVPVDPYSEMEIIARMAEGEQ